MNREAFDASLRLADRLIRAGEHAEAITAMLPWAEVPTVGDFERTILAYNRATILHDAGRREDAIATWREVQSTGWLDEEGKKRVAANLRVATTDS